MRSLRTEAFDSSAVVVCATAIPAAAVVVRGRVSDRRSVVVRLRVNDDRRSIVRRGVVAGTAINGSAVVAVSWGGEGGA